MSHTPDEGAEPEKGTQSMLIEIARVFHIPCSHHLLRSNYSGETLNPLATIFGPLSHVLLSNPPRPRPLCHLRYIIDLPVTCHPSACSALFSLMPFMFFQTSGESGCDSFECGCRKGGGSGKGRRGVSAGPFGPICKGNDTKDFNGEGGTGLRQAIRSDLPYSADPQGF